MKTLKQTGGIIALEYGLLAVAIMSAVVLFLGNFETSLDTELAAIGTEIDGLSADISAGQLETPDDAVTAT